MKNAEQKQYDIMYKAFTTYMKNYIIKYNVNPNDLVLFFAENLPLAHLHASGGNKKDYISVLGVTLEVYDKMIENKEKEGKGE